MAKLRGSDSKFTWYDEAAHIERPEEETTAQYVERLEREHAASGEAPLQPGHLIHDEGGEDPEEVDDGPPVCPGCYAVGPEPHAHDCIDERIRLDQEERFERGEMNDPTDDLGDEEDVDA